MGWAAFFYWLAMVFVAWVIYRRFCTDRAAFSAKNLAKSANTFGWLALMLIGCVTVLVLLLRSS